MNNTGTIQTSNSPDLVTFKIVVDGTALSASYQVKSIAIEKEVNRIPFAQIILVDGEASSQDFALSNEAIFKPGAEVEITAGYHSDEETIFKGVVIKHNIKIRESASVLIIECRDKTVNTTIGRKSKYFYESTDSEIIEEILGAYSLEKEVEATDHSHTEIVQYQSSDWDFLMLRAQANGLICMVDDGKVQFKKPDLEQEEIETVAFGASMLSFDGEIDAREQYSAIKAYSWNPADQEVVEIEAADPGVTLNGNLSASDLANVIGLEAFELRHGGNISDTELQLWSDAKAMFQQLSKTRGRVSFQGIPAVKPGTLLNLEGVGDRYNGKVFVSGIRHDLAEGNWVVHAEFGLNPEWFSEVYDVNPLPAAGLIPAVSGLQIGVVTQLQDDPDGEDKILIQLPIVDNTEQGIWARLATLDAGDGRGTFFRPEIEDEVIVGFINDDPNDAVVLGQLHSSAKPAPETGSDDNHLKGYVSRSEMSLLFDDDKIAFTLETPGGKKITLDEDAGVIIVEDDNGNTVTLDDSGITMDSTADINIKAGGDVNIEGINVAINASAEFKAEGGAGAEMSTSAIAVVKGSIVQIN